MMAEFEYGLLSTRRLKVFAARQVNAPETAPKILLLGGSNFDLDLKTDFKSSALTRHGCVVTYEPRGIGRTELPPGGWRMEDYARDALAVMDALAWDQAVIVGESFGGMTALHMALMAPERVQAMALSSTTAGGAGGGSYDITEFLALSRNDAAARTLQLLDRRNRALALDDPNAYARRLEARLAFELAFARSSISHGGYARLLQARACHDVWDRVPQIKTPTLLISGVFDDQAPLAAQRNLVRCLSHATHWERPAGHGVLFSDPDVLTRLCEDWVPRVLQPALKPREQV